MKNEYIVRLKIGEGSFTQGFPVTLIMGQVGLSPELEINAQLPPAPDIPHQYNLWKNSYLGLNVSNRLEAKAVFISNYSYADNCDRISEELLHSFNNWLDAPSFRPIREKFLAKLNPLDEIRVLIQTENIQLQSLPWHLVDWVKSYTKVEIAIASPNYEKEIIRDQNSSNQVRILAIIGNSQGIETAKDRQLLEQLPHSQITLLTEPTRQTITEILWHPQGWDILFFAGHSSSDHQKKIGYINVNKQDSLTIKELKDALITAVTKGLKIAIFNSCDGLGLARELADLKIPQILVMREPVPDKVAQTFLNYFLASYAQGESLYLAVKEARTKLRGLEDQYPCASWLPVIVQNPSETPPTWNELTNSQSQTSQPKLTVVLALTALWAIAIIGLRAWGILQGWELKAFDYLSQQFPPELGDSRILLVGIEEEDRRNYGTILPDPVLAKLLDRLQQYQPAAIGVDIIRDRAIPIQNSQPIIIKGQKIDDNLKLTEYWQQPNIISVCYGSNPAQSGNPPKASPRGQIGFIDIHNDRQLTPNRDYNVRRYSLSRTPNSRVKRISGCQTNYSLALLLLDHYFRRQDIFITSSENKWQFGSQIINRLVSGSGGFQKFDDKEYQLLISFRRTAQIAQQVTVTDILEERINLDSNWIKDRIVLVGVTARTHNSDFHDTAIGEIPGLYLHAHVISQLISAVEDDRSLIWWFPVWGDWLWIGFWSVVSGLVIWLGRNSIHRTVGIGCCVIVSSGICWFVLTQGGWLAWIPGLLAIAVTGFSIEIYRVIRLKKLRNVTRLQRPHNSN